MDGRRIRGLVSVLAAMAALGLSATPVMASGGGGCGRPVTDAVGATVSIRMFCFTPTIARVRPGTVVTFVNRDGFPHTILGANGSWGSFGELKGGQDLRYRFTRPGTYAYVCTLHPGMVGTVIVGNGGAPGVAGATTASGPAVLVQPSPSPETVTTSRATLSEPAPRADAGPWPAATAAALAMFLLAAAGFVVERRRAKA